MKFPVSGKTFAFMALGAALIGVLLGSSCSHVPPQIAEPAKIVADCGKKAVHEKSADILDDVASALITSDYSGGLRAVATNVAGNLSGLATSEASELAWEITKCAVAELFGQTNEQLGYGNTDAETAARIKTMRDNASQWLSTH